MRRRAKPNEGRFTEKAEERFSANGPKGNWPETLGEKAAHAAVDKFLVGHLLK